MDQATNVPASPTTRTVVEKVKKRKKRNRTIWIALGALLVVVVVLVIVQSRKEKAITVQTEKASHRTITEVVQATGKVQPETSVKISPEVSGEIIQLPLKEGAKVTKNDLLAEILPTAIRAQYEAGQAQVLSAKSQVEQAKAQKINAELNYKRTQKLHEQGISSDADLESSKATSDAATATFNSSQHNVEYYTNSLAQVGESLRKTIVRSPMEGYITQLISRLGEKVVGTGQFSSGTEMMDVSDLSVMNAMVDVDENDVVNLAVGDTARVSIDAFPDRTFIGIVIEIANSAELKGAGTQDQSTNFQVKVRLATFETGELRPGMSCTAKIETQTHTNVLTVPIMAVTRRTSTDTTSTGGGDQVSEVGKAKKAGSETNDHDSSPLIVFVVNGKRVKAVQVKTGISDNSYVEILSGLSGNEEVVKGNYAAVSKDLDDGKLIKVDNSGGAYKTTKK